MADVYIAYVPQAVIDTEYTLVTFCVRDQLQN